ncbi:hypothetical protein IMY05_006G0153400 [Salix suchowensis]|nr:hypothetical protein IMY05_006G0153400 [Salix suchowensis]
MLITYFRDTDPFQFYAWKTQGFIGWVVRFVQIDGCARGKLSRRFKSNLLSSQDSFDEEDPTSSSSPSWFRQQYSKGSKNNRTGNQGTRSCVFLRGCSY